MELKQYRKISLNDRFFFKLYLMELKLEEYRTPEEARNFKLYLMELKRSGLLRHHGTSYL